jgi:hypothetical protein
MNPNLEIKLDIEIAQLTHSIIQGLEVDKLTNAQELAQKLEDRVQHLLKQEWEKSKREARKGRLVKRVRV